MKNNRSIFEDVDTNKKQFLSGGVIDQGRGGARYSICIWLLMLFFLVIIMIVVGGLTRLTDSGLSITEWRPITGAIPPMSTADCPHACTEGRNAEARGGSPEDALQHQCAPYPTMVSQNTAAA